MPAENPWRWRPSPDAWCGCLTGAAEAWSPVPSLILDPDPLRQALLRAIHDRCSWLLHPCLHRLTTSVGGDPIQDDLQLAAWIAAHTPGPLGQIWILAPIWLWAPDGGWRIDSGTHELRALGDRLLAGAAPGRIALDPWCLSLGVPARDSWAARVSLTEGEVGRLQEEMVRFLGSLELLASALPDCADWAVSVTRVAIPLFGGQARCFRSGSAEDLPGVIQLDMGGKIPIFEALIHESAHLHMYLAEASGPLVDPRCQERYPSPLRPEPRPLRGVLKALHALAYICALYSDARRAGLLGKGDHQDDVRVTFEMMEQARGTLRTARRFLTPAGEDFLDRTLSVSEHASG